MSAIKKLIPLLLAAGGALAAAVYLVAPERAEAGMISVFTGRNFAHRGLHTPDKNPPENSLPAFEAAVKAGYGIELDIHITKDDQIVVFHDDGLLRACGAEGRLEDKTYEELSNFKLFGTENNMPLFSELLSIIDLDCPVIVELKRGSKNQKLCELSYALMKERGGTYCVESFDPRIVAWFRRNAPGFMRGQLARHPKDMAKVTSRINAFFIGNLLTNFLSRPHFIAYGLGREPFALWLCRKLGALKFVWTSRDPANEKSADSVIFEFYHPKPRFK